MRVELTLDNRAGSGTIIMEGASVKLIVVGQTGYVQPSPSFWRTQCRPARGLMRSYDLFRGKWLKVSADNHQFGSLARLGRKNDLIQARFDDLGSAVRSVRSRQIDGVTCAGILGGDRVLWVRPSDARAVRLAGPKEVGSLRFDRYDVVASHVKPPGDRVVHYDNLRSRRSGW
jgi:hypothetical protein